MHRSPKRGIKTIQKLAEKIANSLKKAKNPLIISGISCNDQQMIHAALNISATLRSTGSNVMLSMVLPECNSMGLSLMPGKSFEELFSSEKKTDKLIIVENDLYRRAAKESVNKLFKNTRQIIVLDHLPNSTAQNADILLPAATFAESEGTLVNNEGRAQRYYKAIVNKDQVKESWRWIDELNTGMLNSNIQWNRVDDIVESLANELPVFSKLRNYEPDADFRMLNTKIPRQTIRYSGRTAMTANINVSEPRPPQDPDSPLAFSMEGQNENPPSSLVPFYWSPGWNSVQALYKITLDEPDESLKGGDPGIRLFESERRTARKFYFKQAEESTEKSADEVIIIPVLSDFWK